MKGRKNLLCIWIWFFIFIIIRQTFYSAAFFYYLHLTGFPTNLQLSSAYKFSISASTLIQHFRSEIIFPIWAFIIPFRICIYLLTFSLSLCELIKHFTLSFFLFRMEVSGEIKPISFANLQFFPAPRRVINMTFFGGH